MTSQQSPAPEGGPAPASSGPRLAQLFRAILAVPLFYKLTVANAGVVVLGAVASAALAVGLGGVQRLTALSAIVEGALLALILGVVVNVVLVTLALRPLGLIEAAARQIEQGKEEIRVARSELADADLGRLVDVFNGMLDSQQRARRQERGMALLVLDAEEAERRQISRELYDEAAQDLAALLLQLRVIEGPWEGTAEPAAEPLAALRESAQRALDSVRRLARRLRPPELDDLGLVKAIEAHARTFTEVTGLPVSVELRGREPVLSPERRLAAYRIVEEALRNAAGHAEAHRVRVGVGRADGWLVLTIWDDGRGFAPEAVLPAAPGLGLRRMRERAGLVGGTFLIDSEPRRGTRLEARFPLGGDGGEVARPTVVPSPSVATSDHGRRWHGDHGTS